MQHIDVENGWILECAVGGTLDTSVGTGRYCGGVWVLPQFHYISCE